MMSEICIEKSEESDNDPELGAKRREMKIASQLSPQPKKIIERMRV